MTALNQQSRFFERPVPPEPLRIACRVVVPDRRMNLAPERVVAMVRSELCHQLAKEIAQKTQMISDQDILSSHEFVTIDFTINDRGTYQNWLPVERKIGRNEGFKEALDKAPYGLSPAEQEAY